MTVAMAAASNSGLSLDQLAAVLAPVGARVMGDRSVRVTDVSQDSRQVKPGFAFVARSGAGAHGLQFAAGAIAAGARALITQDEVGARAFSVPTIVVEHERKALALAAEALHDFPSRALKVIAVTGTNGKTTVAVLTEYALQSCGQLAARLGTLGFSFQGQVVPSNLTTEEADQVSRRLAQVRDAGGTHCVLEASSHALSQHRLDGLQIEVAAFTNLTQDHLDYHGDLKRYGEAKARLFSDLSPRKAVIHTGDAFGDQLAQRFPSAIRVGQAANCHIRPLTVVCDAAGIHGELATPSGAVRVDSPLVGRHNLENILVVLGIASALGLDLQRVASQLAAAPSVPGRFERCDVASDSISVLVDYAHTPDALSRVLKACRELCSGKLICVFGCGGDRDPGKRPQMGQVAGTQADFVIVTNDNPRSEDPEKIAAAVLSGVQLTNTAHVKVLDRKSAIERAIGSAQAGDLVLLAGKGHETYQIIGAQRTDFDDRQEAREALQRRRAREGVTG